jgi:hypothetical protein
LNLKKKHFNNHKVGGGGLNLYIMTLSAEDVLFFPGGNYPLSQNSYIVLHISFSRSYRFLVLLNGMRTASY